VKNSRMNRLLLPFISIATIMYVRNKVLVAYAIMRWFIIQIEEYRKLCLNLPS
jgi:hypothetical protein